MTLFRQMALLISLLMTLLLGTVITITFNNAIEAIEEQLYEDAKNTASSLSLSLGTAGADETIMSTMINANFDSGHYTRIALNGISKQLIYERISEQSDENVPQWFIALVPVSIPVASAQVSSGWSPIGVLEVQSDSTYAYILLYSQLTKLFALFAILSVIGLGLLSFVLHIVLRPLKKTQLQAEAIMKNEFITQKQIPYTIEFRDVVNAMNAMVIKVNDIFEKSDKAMHHNHILLYKDELTTLHNRRYLMMKLPQYIGDETAYGHGVLMLFALHGTLEANQIIGHKRVDGMLNRIGTIIRSSSEHFNDAIAARVNGTEFMLLLPGCKEDEGLKIARQTDNEIRKLFTEHDLNDKERFGVTAGIVTYNRDNTTGEILSGVDYALSQANLMAQESVYFYKNHTTETIMGKDAWRSMITDALEHNRFSLEFWPVYNTKSKTLHHKVMTFSLEDSEQTSCSYGKFIAPVITLGLLAEVYLNVIRQMLHLSAAKIASPNCSLRLPEDFFHTPNITHALEPLFEAHAETLDFNLVFDIPEHFIARNMELANSFITLFKRYGFAIGIYQFTGESQEHTYLKELKPAYIKADISFLLDQDQTSMSALQIITDSLGIELIATGITDEDELENLKSFTVHTIQGTLAEVYSKRS